MAKAGLKKERKRGKPSKARKWIVIAVILVLIIACIVWISHRAKKENGAAAGVNLYTVSYGNVENTISGSASIEAKDMYTVTSSVKGAIWEDYFDEGDTVQEGDLLYYIEDTDYQSDLSDAYADIEDAKKTLSSAQEDVQDAKSDLKEAKDDLQNATVTAPIDGVITALSVLKGDSVNNGMTVAEIIDNRTMLLTIDFNAEDARRIAVGNTASVTLTGSSKSLSGKVSRVASGSIANSYGVPVTAVEIKVENPGGITESSTASAVVNGYACNNIGSFSYSDTASVKVRASGEISVLRMKKGDAVSAGDVLMTLDSESLTNAVKNAQNALESAETRVDNAERQVKTAQSRYDSLKDKEKEYKVTAPITGTVIQKMFKAGDKLDVTNGANSLAIIADLSYLEMEVSVDELDIMSVKNKLDELTAANALKAENEKPDRISVRVTADAVEDKTFYGYVDNVSIVGTSYTGSTAYPVKIILENEEGSDEDINDYLIPGMNVTCEIMVESKQNVLLIPVSAVGRGNTVERVTGGVKEEDSPAKKSDNKEEAGIPDFDTADGERPSPPDFDGADGERPSPPDFDGEKPDFSGMKDTNKDKENKTVSADGETLQTETVSVTLGITDGAYIEVLSGLSEGDKIVLPDTTASYSGSLQNDQGGFPGFGGAPSGMDGPPSGMSDPPSGMSGAPSGSRSGSGSGSRNGSGGMPSGNMPGGGGMR